MRDQDRTATDAVLISAERLGVDPFRLARFLQDGRLADLVTALARRDQEGGDRGLLTRLTREYREFLEYEEQMNPRDTASLG